jgi:hypothetical protein
MYIISDELKTRVSPSAVPVSFLSKARMAASIFKILSSVSAQLIITSVSANDLFSLITIFKPYTSLLFRSYKLILWYNRERFNLFCASCAFLRLSCARREVKKKCVLNLCKIW